MNTMNNDTPLLFIGSCFSSRDQRLLSQIAEQNTPIHQLICQNTYEYIELNQSYTSVTIEQVRDLQKQLSYGAHSATPRIVIIHGLDTASLPAQNALLKLLEEPPAHTYLCATAFSSHSVLPTILSRVRCIESAASTAVASTVGDEGNLQRDAARLGHISHRELCELADTYSEHSAALAFITAAMTYWHQQITESKDIKRAQRILFLLQKAYEQIKKNANSKLALEHALFEMKALFS